MDRSHDDMANPGRVERRMDETPVEREGLQGEGGMEREGLQGGGRDVERENPGGGSDVEREGLQGEGGVEREEMAGSGRSGGMGRDMDARDEAVGGYGYDRPAPMDTGSDLLRSMSSDRSGNLSGDDGMADRKPDLEGGMRGTGANGESRDW